MSRLRRVDDLLAGVLLVLLGAVTARGPFWLSPFAWVGTVIFCVGVLSRVLARPPSPDGDEGSPASEVLREAGARPRQGGRGLVLDQGPRPVHATEEEGLLHLETVLPAAPDPPFLVRSAPDGAWEVLLLATERTRLGREEVRRTIRAARPALERARDLRDGTRVEATLARRRVVLTWHGIPETTAEVDTLLETVRALVELAVSGRAPDLESSGLEIVEEEEGDGEAEARCRICGDAVEGTESRACATCGAPYHEECWTFHGRCAIYGCRGRDATG